MRGLVLLAATVLTLPTLSWADSNVEACLADPEPLCVLTLADDMIRYSGDAHAPKYLGSSVAGAWASHGAKDRAHDLAAALPSPSTRAEAWGTIAATLGDEESRNSAIAEARGIAYPLDRVHALLSLSRRLDNPDPLMSAVTEVEKIADVGIRHQALIKVSAALAASGRSAIARSTARVMAQDDTGREATLAAVVDAEASDSRLDDASTTFAEMIPGPARDEAASTLARALALNGDASAALALADNIADEDAQAWALASVVAAGGIEQLDRIPWGEARDMALSSLSSDALQAGDTRAAQDAAQDIGNDETRAIALRAVARKVSGGRATMIAAEIDHPEIRAAIMADAAETTAKTGRVIAAVAMADSIALPAYQALGLLKVAAVTGDTDMFARAMTAAETLSQKERDDAIAAIATAQADSGNFGAARVTTEAIADAEHRGFTEWEIARLEALATKTGMTAETLSAITAPLPRALALSKIGEHASALKAALEVTEFAARAETLIIVASAMR